MIYREVKANRLKAARVGGRRELRFLATWIDDWLIAYCTIQSCQETVGRPARRSWLTRHGRQALGVRGR